MFFTSMTGWKWHSDILPSPWPQSDASVYQWSDTVSRSTNYHTCDSSLTLTFTQLNSVLHSVVTTQWLVWTLIFFYF